MDSVFPDLRQAPTERRHRELMEINEDLQPTIPLDHATRKSGQPVPLTHLKGKQSQNQERLQERDQDDEVLLLTKHKSTKKKP